MWGERVEYFICILLGFYSSTGEVKNEQLELYLKFRDNYCVFLISNGIMLKS